MSTTTLDTAIVNALARLKQARRLQDRVLIEQREHTLNALLDQLPRDHT